MIAKFNNMFRKFHRDEEGLEALQVVMILAIAGLIMIAASAVGKSAVDWMSDKWKELKKADGQIKAKVN